MDKETIEEIALHLLKTIALEVGRVNIKDLTDRFSQLLVDLRKKFHSSKEIKSLLMKYPELFVVKKEIVNKFPGQDIHGYVANQPVGAVSPHINVESDDDEAEEMEDDSEDAEDEEDGGQMSGNARIPIEGKGKIKRKFDQFGFIEYSNSNYTTVIYFDVRSFENRQHEDLGCLKLNEEVYFRAKPSIGHSAPYRATKVWRPGYHLSQRDTMRCHSSSASVASQDSFQSDDLDDNLEPVNATENYGFTRARKETQRNDSLKPSKRERRTLEKAKQLDDFIEIEDYVYFSSMQLRKGNTVEEVKTSETPKSTVKHRTKRKNKKTTESMPNTGCSAHTFGFNNSETDDRSCHSSQSDGMERMVDTLYSQVGNIYDLLGNKPVINFGKNETAIVPPNTVYKNGKLLGELGWELDEGTEVKFDAKHDNGNWWAELVWIGDKPQVESKKSRQKNNLQPEEDLRYELGNASLDDDEHSGGIRRYRSSPHLDPSSWNNRLDESPRSRGYRRGGARPSHAENYPKTRGGNNNKKKFTGHRKYNNISEATPSATRGYRDYYE